MLPTTAVRRHSGAGTVLLSSLAASAAWPPPHSSVVQGGHAGVGRRGVRVLSQASRDACGVPLLSGLSRHRRGPGLRSQFGWETNGRAEPAATPRAALAGNGGLGPDRHCLWADGVGYSDHHGIPAGMAPSMLTLDGKAQRPPLSRRVPALCVPSPQWMTTVGASPGMPVIR